MFIRNIPCTSASLSAHFWSLAVWGLGAGDCHPAARITVFLKSKSLAYYTVRSTNNQVGFALWKLRLVCPYFTVVFVWEIQKTVYFCLFLSIYLHTHTHSHIYRINYTLNMQGSRLRWEKCYPLFIDRVLKEQEMTWSYSTSVLDLETQPKPPGLTGKQSLLPGMERRKLMHTGVNRIVPSVEYL